MLLMPRQIESVNFDKKSFAQKMGFMPVFFVRIEFDNCESVLG